MKTTFLLAAIFFSSALYAQDTMQLKQIDALVHLINTSAYKTQKDTVKNDQPQMGLSIRTYLVMVTDGTELKKYVNNIHAISQENGTSKQMITTSTFYFDHNKLIKVEESGTQDGKIFDMLWYYANDKPLYYTARSDKAPQRAELLLTMAKSISEKMGFK